MTRGVVGLFAMVIVAGAGIARVEAHHSIARFDGGRIVAISGIVTVFRWINPHASIEIDSPGSEGVGREQWVVEMQAPTTMMGAGWTRDLLAAGDRITVFAHPLRERGASVSHRGLYAGAILADGRTLGRVEELHRKGDE